MSEIRIHNSLKHQNVVCFDHFFEDKHNIYILLEMCSNRTLNELLVRRKRLTELEVRCYLVQLVAGLKYIHSNHIIHRDLKLRNLFLTDKMKLKIADFGLATKIKYQGDKRRTVCGTPNYMAPEIIAGSNGHSYEVDIWALGIVLYVLLIGRPPFETPDVNSTYARIQSCSFEFPSEIPISDEAKDLITKMLTLDPSKRLSLDQILRHKFVADYEIPKLMPISTLVCPPTESFSKQYTVDQLTIISKVSFKVKKKSPRKYQSSVAIAQAGGAPLSEFEVHVKNWFDHYKYGFGYLMSNDCIGITFHDESKVLLHPTRK
jgi:polo-like kinase 1